MAEDTLEKASRGRGDRAEEDGSQDGLGGAADKGTRPRGPPAPATHHLPDTGPAPLRWTQEDEAARRPPQGCGFPRGLRFPVARVSRCRGSLRASLQPSSNPRRFGSLPAGERTPPPVYEPGDALASMQGGHSDLSREFEPAGSQCHLDAETQ